MVMVELFVRKRRKIAFQELRARAQREGKPISRASRARADLIGALGAEERITLARRLVELFDQIDVNGDTVLEWEEFSAFCIESGMAQSANANGGKNDMSIWYCEDPSKGGALGSNIDVHRSEVEKMVVFNLGENVDTGHDHTGSHSHVVSHAPHHKLTKALLQVQVNAKALLAKVPAKSVITLLKGSSTLRLFELTSTKPKAIGNSNQAANAAFNVTDGSGSAGTPQSSLDDRPHVRILRIFLLFDVVSKVMCYTRRSSPLSVSLLLSPFLSCSLRFSLALLLFRSLALSSRCLSRSLTPDLSLFLSLSSRSLSLRSLFSPSLSRHYSLAPPTLFLSNTSLLSFISPHYVVL